MAQYQIISSAGVDMGTYKAESPEAALDAMARDAGYANQAEAAATVGAFDGSVQEIESWTVENKFGDASGWGLTREQAIKAAQQEADHVGETRFAVGPGGLELVDCEPQS